MNAPELRLDAAKAALVLIDLQAGIAALPVQPHGAASVLANARAFADRFRALGAPVVLVKVAFPNGPGGLRRLPTPDRFRNRQSRKAGASCARNWPCRRRISS